ncbi:Chloroperoxidase [Phytophthora cinnamomi]|uniref:Chloroperoxidase n=1 Tax=Phytophthora cinnamomi TaxID=4785 RepID=UPI0035595457|nr:Chloroperoxidase [Phytophthora cinnamomi]
MVSITASFVFVAAAFGVTYGYTEAEAEAALAEAAALPVGEYYRPPTHLTSGAVNATTPFRRSPCPAMNTLANHGYLPRDGKNITVDQALAVVMERFNIAEDLAAVMGSLSPDLFDMNDLSKHNDKVEHDASLARIDSYFGVDPYLITPGLINDVLNYGLDGSVDVTDVATIRAARVAWGEEHNPEFDFGATPAFIAGAESALFLRGFGGDNGNSTATTFVATFFLQEMFPEGWTKPSTSITYDDAIATISYLNAVDV